MTVLLAVVSCGPRDSAPVATHTDSSRIDIITSAATDRPLNWTFQTVHILGGKEEGPEAFYRVPSGFVNADGQGHLFVLDATAKRVVVFDTTGAVIRLLGGQGSGPGEMRSAASLAVSPEGEVAVFDFGKGKLVRFGSAGDTLPELVFPYYPAAFTQRHIGMTSNAIVVASARSSPQDPPAVTLRQIGPADTTRLAAIDRAAGTMVAYPRCQGGLNLPPLFVADLVWDTDGTRIALNATPEYVVNIIEDGRVVRSLRRPIAPRPATRELAMQELGEGFRINFGRGPCLIPPDEMVDGRGYAEVIPAIAQVRIAPTGEVWVERREVGPNAMGPIDVFDAAGEYVGTLPAGTPVPLVLMGNGRVARVQKDEADVERIEVVRLQR